MLFGEFFETFQTSIFIIREINHNNRRISENSFSSTLIKFKNNGISDGFKELFESSHIFQFIQNQIFISIIKISENNKSKFLTNIQFFFEFLRMSIGKWNSLIVKSECLEFLQNGLFTFIQPQKNCQIIFLEFLQIRKSSQLFHSTFSLALNPTWNWFLGSLSIVINWFSIDK